MSSEIDYTRRYNDKLSQVYDVATANGAWTPNLVLQAELPVDIQAARILDLGCGTGQTLEVLTRQWPNATYIGVDFSESMLEFARKKFPHNDFQCRDVVRFVSQPLTFGFDLISAIGVLEFVPDLLSVLPKILSQLQAGGVFMFTYEPLIDDLPGQSERVTVTRVPAKDEDLSFTTYRWTPSEIEAAVSRLGRIDGGRLFVSYHRGEAPVVYHLVSVYS